MVAIGRHLCAQFTCIDRMPRTAVVRLKCGSSTKTASEGIYNANTGQTKLMLGYFTAPFADELFYSVIARLADELHLRGVRPISEKLFGVYVRPTVELPSHLNYFVDQLPPHHTYTAGMFVDKHSMFPYYAWLVESRQRKIARAFMLKDGGDHTRMRLGMAARRTARRTTLRFCPSCIDQDRQRHGIAYWHRAHQLPGVIVCPHHRDPLYEAERAVTQSYTPLEALDMSKAGRAFLGAIPRVAAEVAGEAWWVLSGATTGPLAESLSQSIGTLLVDAGWASANGRVAASRLVRYFRNFYGDEYLKHTDCSVHEVDDNWLLRIARGHPRSPDPLHFVLLAVFLQTTLKSLVQSTGEMRSTKPAIRTPVVRRAVLQLGSERRAAWLEAMRSRPAVGTKALRQEFPALYAWLYRNDLEWLKSHQPPIRTRSPKARVDWTARDKELAESVLVAAEQLRTIQPRSRVTKTLIGRTIGRLSILEKWAPKLPRTVAALEAVCETVEEYRHRRIRETVVRLQLDGKPMAFSTFYRLAGLRSTPTSLAEQQLIADLLKAGW